MLSAFLTVIGAILCAMIMIMYEQWKFLQQIKSKADDIAIKCNFYDCDKSSWILFLNYSQRGFGFCQKTPEDIRILINDIKNIKMNLFLFKKEVNNFINALENLEKINQFMKEENKHRVIDTYNVLHLTTIENLF
jgi:hypothetical protein